VQERLVRGLGCYWHGSHQRAGLLDDAALEASAVVANCDMNRDRRLAGVSSGRR
jgi:hypothetical protein